MDSGPSRVSTRATSNPLCLVVWLCLTCVCSLQCFVLNLYGFKERRVSTWVAMESVGFLVFQIQCWKVESGWSTIFSLIQRKGFVTNIFWKSVFICKPNLRQTYSYIAALCATLLSYSVTCRMFGYLIFGRRPPALWIMIPIIISLISSIDFLKISGQLPLKHVFSWCADNKFCQHLKNIHWKCE